MLRSIKCIKGFTMLELLSSVLILVLVFSATLVLYIMLDKMWKSSFALNELARNSAIASERMIRGYTREDGVIQPGVEEAKSISQPLEGTSSSILEYKDLNDQLRRFYYSNGKIYTESNEPVLSDVESASFTHADNAVKMDWGTLKDLGYKEVRFHLETNVKPRNAG